MVKPSHKAPVRSALAPFFISLLLGAGSLAGGNARAQTEEAPPPHETDRAMPGIIRVGLPVPAHAPLVFAGSAGYGYIDPTFGLQVPGHRLDGSLAGAYSPVPFLSFGLSALGRMDNFGPTTDREANLYGEPSIFGRFQHKASDSVYFGAELNVRIVGEEAPSVDFGALSPALRGLFGAKLGPNTWLAAELGFHLDNSHNALPDPELILPSDRITVSASTSPSIPWGVGASHRLSQGTEILGEVAGALHVGANAPSALESPWGVSLGARHPVLPILSLMASIDVGLSARQDPLEADILFPVNPRVAGHLTAIFRFGAKKAAPPPPPPQEKKPEAKEPPPVEDTAPPINTTPVTGMIIDEGGRPLSDAQVTLTMEGAEPAVQRSFADGRFEFAAVPEGPVTLLVETPGYDKVKVSLEDGSERKREIVLYPSLPAGQVRGVVRDLKGNPLAAIIVITPGNKEIQASADGSFDLELAPGNYTVRFEHPELSPQKRVIRVQDRGVVILSIALSP